MKPYRINKWHDWWELWFDMRLIFHSERWEACIYEMDMHAWRLNDFKQYTYPHSPVNTVGE